MLPTHLISSGSLNNSQQNSLSLFRDEPTLILGDPLHTVTTDQWKFYPTNKSTGWRGIIIGGITIEADLASRFDERATPYRPGQLIVRGSDTYVTSMSTDGWSAPVLVGINGPAITDEGHEQGFGFTRWQIVVREGDTKFVLATIDDRDGSQLLKLEF